LRSAGVSPARGIQAGETPALRGDSPESAIRLRMSFVYEMEGAAYNFNARKYSRKSFPKS